MTRTHRLNIVPAIVAALAFGGVTPALAQAVSQSVDGYPQVSSQPQGVPTASQQTTKSYTQAPVAHFFGMPVVIASPLDAAYDAAGEYSTYEGQPGGGMNGVLANDDAGSPE